MYSGSIQEERKPDCLEPTVSHWDPFCGGCKKKERRGGGISEASCKGSKTFLNGRSRNRSRKRGLQWSEGREREEGSI